MTFAKKSLGQNFLKSEKALRAIVDAGGLEEKEAVLEIGPGRGALTEKLLRAGARVIAVEKDDSLVPFLGEKFKSFVSQKKLKVVRGDILELSAKDLGLKKYKLIANIPYYITGAVIRKFLEEKLEPELMVLLLQKEVAERIVARDGKESLLSVAVKAYSTPKFIAKVPRGAFAPAPNVDSAIVAFENISKKFFTENKISEEKFFALLHAGFAHKRKKLGGNLKNLSGLNQEAFEKFKDKRAEELLLDNWKTIYLGT